MNHISGVHLRRFAGMVVLGAGMALFAGNALQAAEGGMAREMIQKKIAAIKASTAENQKKLHQYSWTETQQVSTHGRELPAKESQCRYGPDGKVQKTPMGGAERQRGRMAERIMEKKKEEMKDYMGEVSQVIHLYMPPNPELMQKAFKADKASFDRGASETTLVFKDYAKRGDSMTLEFDKETHKIRRLDIHTYMETPQDAVTLSVDFATLPDGTSHASRTVFDAKGKDLRVVSTNSNYKKIAG